MMSTVRTGVIAGLAIVVGLAPMAASHAATMVTPSAGRAYVLGPSDVIEASVLGKPDFTTKGRIGDDGTFRVPFVGAIAAANRTPVELADDLAKALETGGFFAHPIVKVEVVSYASRYVTVLGAVQRPDLVTVDREYRLSEILARVGGVRDGGADYVNYRPKDGPERIISIVAMATGDVKDDPYVSPGDKVYVPEADMFYISGQVKTPGAYPLKPGMTFRMALSRGGGLTDAGTDRGVTLTRDGKKTKHIDLDGKVMKGDTLVVGERLF